MSVQTQIDRLTANVSAALAEIANKGVTVPVSAGSDDLAALIEAIPLTIPTAAVEVELGSAGSSASGVSGQVERLRGNIQAALTAVAGKNVTVPAGTTSDGLAALIASIVQAPAAAFVYVYGAPSETVTLTHTDGTEYTVSTNAHGASETTIELPPGDYTVVGSVSKGSVASRTVAVSNDTTVVTAYPPGAIFWYGNGDTEGDTLWSKCGGWTPISGAYPAGQGRTGAAWNTYAYGQASGENGWYTFANHARSSAQYGATSRITNLIDYTGYTKCLATVTSYVQNSGKSGIGLCASGPTGTGAWTATAYNALSTISSPRNGSMDLSGSSGYFCAAAFGANYVKPYGSGVYYAHTANNTVYAVWLE